MLARLFSTLVATTALLSAQNDYNLDKLSPGRLGASLDLAVSGAPANQLILYVVSTNGGPVPLAAIDPLDSRFMEVGIDLLDVLTVAATSPTGQSSLNVPFPNDPALQGGVLHWQSVMLQLGTNFFGQLGNKVVTQLGLPGVPTTAPASLANARAFAAGLVDANNNAGAGDVLITGGGGGTLTAATGLASTELFDFRRLARTPGPNMSTARALHLAVRLADNRVLLIGGADATGVVLSSCEIYNPTTTTFTPAASMSTPRILHAACRLADGRVLVAGGTSALQPDVTAAILGTLNSCEIYNPATNTWSATASLGGARLGPALTLLPSNQVLVSGGVQVSVLFGIPIAASSVTTTQRWNPTTGTWGAGAPMAAGRAGHHYNQVTLADGRVLMTGGVNIPNLLGATTAAPIAGAEAYNPTTNTWQTFNMPNARALHTATRLPDGRVVCAGGAQGTLLAPTSIDLVDVFNPATNTWSPANVLSQPRASHVAQLLPDSTLALFGGQGASFSLSDIELLRY